MAITHTNLTGYFDEQLGDMKSILAITSYNDTITRALLDYGIDADFNSSDGALNTLLATATDVSKLIALAMVNLWKYALNLASSKYQQSADGASLSRQQMHDMIMKNLKLANIDAAEYVSGGEMKIYKVHPTESPYSFDPLRVER